MRSPLFAWLHYYDPHQPYVPPEKYIDPTLKAVEASSPDLRQFFRKPDGSPTQIDNPRKYQIVSSMNETKRANLNRLARGRYRGEIAFIDSQISRIVSALKSRDMYHKTLIVFVADHGENFLNRGPALAFGHAGLFSDVVRLPLIMKLPNSELAGTICDFLVGNLDIMPTILEILGVTPPEVGSGKSFLRALQEPEDATFREHLVLEGPREKKISVRTAKWMYREVIDPVTAARIRTNEPPLPLGYGRGIPSELYDLGSDSEETVNLIDTKAQRAARGRLRAVVKKFLATKKNGKAESIKSQEQVEALRALGYTQ